MGGLKCVVFLVMVASALQFADAQGLGAQVRINISGIVSCSLNGSIIVNATTPTPPFPNALVELVCNGRVISTAITNGTGMFNIPLNLQQVSLSNLLSPNCNVRVATPLSNCNATLPSTGFLQSPLQVIGNIVRGLLTITTLGPIGFQLRTN